MPDYGFWTDINKMKWSDWLKYTKMTGLGRNLI